MGVDRKEEQKKRQELYREYREDSRKRAQEIEAGFNAQQKKFCQEIESGGVSNWADASSYAKDFLEGLQKGIYQKPSDFVQKKLEWMFKGYIFPRFKQALMHALDKSNQWAYSTSYYRRSFRTATYYMDRMFGIIKTFHREMVIDADVIDILSLKLSEKEKAYFLCSGEWGAPGCGSDAIAYELDSGNFKLEEVITDIVNGDGEVPVTRYLIRGIVKSDNVKMYDLLGRLLVAARLQEGLRQSICENMDMGTVAAFRYLLKVIQDNQLIRFSAVKRAVGTWLGLIEPETGKLERISDKSIDLIGDCLADENVAKEYLSTEDSMKIYVALWSMGVSEVKTAMDAVLQISKSGSHHQLLTAGYFCDNLDNAVFSHRLAKEVIADHKDEKDILAVYLPHFMENWESYARREATRHRLSVKEYFENVREATEYYDLMLEIYEGMDRKKVEFSPCIFPWYSAELTQSAVIARLCVLAKMLNDQAKIDFVCQLIKDCDTDTRSLCLKYTLDNPSTPVQKEVLTALLCDKESWTRSSAREIVNRTKLDEANYLQMEEMLRYKAADMREYLIEMLYKQSDEKLEGTVERLLLDKKEEKRTAGLDIVMQLAADTCRKRVYDNCVIYVKAMENPTSKEQILIENILGTDGGNGDGVSKEPTKVLYQESDVYRPEIHENALIENAVSVFMDYFPQSKLQSQIYGSEEKKSFLGALKSKFAGEKAVNGEAFRTTLTDCQSLERLFRTHSQDEFKGYGGEVYTMSCQPNSFRECVGEFKFETPGLALWKQWYEDNIGDYRRLYRMYILLIAPSLGNIYDDAVNPYIKTIFGDGFQKCPVMDYKDHLRLIVARLLEDYNNKEEQMKLGVALAYWYIKCLPMDKVLLPVTVPANSYHREKEAHFIAHMQLIEIFGKVFCRNDDKFDEMFPLAVKMAEKTFYRPVSQREDVAGYYYASEVTRLRERYWVIRPYHYGYSHGQGSFSRPGVDAYLIAAHRGLISESAMYEFLFRKENLSDTFKTLSLVVTAFREKGRQVAGRGYRSTWEKTRKHYIIRNLLGRFDDEDNESDTKEWNAEELAMLSFVDRVYDVVMEAVLSKELKRGDSETPFSAHIREISRIYGMENLIAVLTAMGEDSLERSTYFSSESKRGCMSHLLSVCIPAEDDDAQKMKGLVKNTDIKEMRLIEAALYAPEWIDIVGEYLGWEGFKSACYYFMAHMNERFDDSRKAMIAKYTPLSEEELNQGAFDIKWFENAYETLGQKRFDAIYKAAKYISDGSKHSRARKYADAVLGKLDKAETAEKISDKRNKDLLMAYSLIPLMGEDDIAERYLFLQQFLKESKKFGSQRIASEKTAVEIAMSNLAMNAGYSDVTRLTLRMESKLVDDSKELFEDKEIEEIVVRLHVDEKGKTEILCSKGGKALKSVPAKFKKHEHILLLNATKKKLTEQFRRTKIMFEQAMEDETAFTVSEIGILQHNPVALPIVKNLVFKCEEKLGFLADNRLTDYEGNETVLSGDAQVAVAHPYHIYRDGHWVDYQRVLFDRQMEQSFKQVFRELYVKTEEELEMKYSRRYSGNQIQPQKTVACLKQRRWVADVEDGLQKVYYKENIVARIYAMADWFSPSDIEAPTLEWVEFADRKTGSQLEISKIPDVIFSEVMRDVDLAVSVAHAGGVDPETSHSTIEMRGALLGFVLPMFKLDNVHINKNHAIVDGHYGTYHIHLGSGVIHKEGGAMVNVLPVHSQHRGKIFLPFADDDPKTAEIITKVLMFAEDKKIKDPSITAQII